MPKTTRILYPVIRGTCWGAPTAIPGYYLVFVHPTPAFAWQTTGGISAEVSSTSKPSAWRSLEETAASVQGQATYAMMMTTMIRGTEKCVEFRLDPTARRAVSASAELLVAVCSEQSTRSVCRLVGREMFVVQRVPQFSVPQRRHLSAARRRRTAAAAVVPVSVRRWVLG